MVWVLLGVALLNVVAKFEKIFQDFKTDLPATTIALINFCHWLRCYWYLAVLLVLVWPFLNYGIVSLLSPLPGVVLPRRLWHVATWLVILAVILFALFAPLPLEALINRLSSGAAGPGAPPQ